MSLTHSIRERITSLFGPWQWSEAKVGPFILGAYNPHKAALWKRIRGGSFEPEETQLVPKLVQKCDLFIDIGAHIGYFSCLAHASNPRITNAAFEPNRTNFKSLKKNFERNGISTRLLWNIGLGSKRENLTLYGTDSASSVERNSFKDLPAQKQQVEIHPLDAFVSKFENFTNVFVKIDVEGHEYDLFLGAQKFMKNIKPNYMLVEIVRHIDNGENPNFVKTLEILKSFGYEAYELSDLSRPLADFHSLQGGNYFFKAK